MGEFFGNEAADVVVGEIESQEMVERGYLRRYLVGEIVAGEIDEPEAGAVGERQNAAV